MSTAANVESRIQNVSINEDTIAAQLVDGRTITVPLAWSWRLVEATPTQRANFEIIGSGSGIRWPDIDEDISVEGMLNGVPARRPAAAPAVEVSLFKDSYEPFVALLQEAGIEFSERPPQAGVVMNSGLQIAVVVTAGLVKVIVAYLKARQSRKVIITTKNNTVVHFQAEGLNPSELERVIPQARNMNIIETKRE